METFKDAFINFSKFGNTNSDGTQNTLSQSDKWFKQAKAFTKELTTTDTAITFNKLKQKTLSYSDYEKFLEDLCKTKKVDLEQLKKQLIASGMPGTAGTTAAVKVGGVDRLTDTSKYTGAHKERFDASGKGKGKEGREDVHDNTGYVGNYKGKDTFDKK